MGMLSYLKTKQELSDLDDDSTDIFKSNIIEHYCNRPASEFLLQVIFVSHNLQLITS